MADKRRDSNGNVLPENVTQRKDGTYMWRKNVRGKQYTLYARTLGEIKRKRNVALGEIEAGTYKSKREKMQEEKEAAKKDMTLNEWFFQWEKVYREGKVKENTLQHNHKMYMNYFLNNIGRERINSIKNIHVTQVLNGMHQAGLSYATLERANTILCLSFDDAVKNGLIEINPARGALSIKREKQKHARVLTEQEENAFMCYIKDNPYYKYKVPLFIVGFNTGMRIGQILALTWQDIDFKNNVIHVNKTLSAIKDYIGGKKQRLVITTPKTEASIRDVPMVAKVREAFLEQKKIQPKCNMKIDGYSDFVFTSRNGHAFYPSNIRATIHSAVNAMNKNISKVAEMRGEEPKLFEHFSPHSMRHTFATRCYEKGVREKVVQKILGHNKLDMTLNTYTHVTKDMTQEDILKLED